MSLDLMEEDTPAARAAAHHVGLAWGLTGLLRAVPFHAIQRRRYLPADMLHAAGISDTDLAEGRAGPSLSGVARSLAEQAASHLRAARDLRPQIAGPARRALLPAVLADLYLKRLARHGFDVFAPAVQQKVGSRALRLALAAWRRRY
jgi:NADH dehydrogenase [ubiquinone] 1 alpha subcomplex assembly factor 6